MTGHKFTVGQLVEFDKSAKPWPKVVGPFEVLRVQPADDPRLREYRIKNKSEPFERSAKEHELVAVADIPDEPQVWRTEPSTR
jgi:hypothetical protein